MLVKIYNSASCEIGFMEGDAGDILKMFRQYIEDAQAGDTIKFVSVEDEDESED